MAFPCLWQRPPEDRETRRLVEAAKAALHLKSRERRRQEVLAEKVTIAAASGDQALAKACAPLSEATVTRIVQLHRLYSGWQRSEDFPRSTIFADMDALLPLLDFGPPPCLVCLGADGTANVTSSRIAIPGEAALPDSIRDFRSTSLTTLTCAVAGRHSDDAQILVGATLDGESFAKLDCLLFESRVVHLLTSYGFVAYLLVDGGLYNKVTGLRGRCGHCLKSRVVLADDPECTSHPVMHPKVAHPFSCGGALPMERVVVGIGHVCCTIMLRILKSMSDDEYSGIEPLIHAQLGVDKNFRQGRRLKLDIEDLERLLAAGLVARLAPRWRAAVAIVAKVFVAETLPASWQDDVGRLHRILQKEGGAKCFTVGAHQIGHTLSFCAHHGGQLNLVRENLVERTNQIQKTLGRFFSGDLVLAMSTFNGRQSVERVWLGR